MSISKKKKNIPNKEVDKILDKALNAKDKDVKVRITTYIGSDVYRELKSQAAKKKIGYQVYMDQVLRNALFKDD